jgi:hypothetical protein
VVSNREPYIQQHRRKIEIQRPARIDIEPSCAHAGTGIVTADREVVDTTTVGATGKSSSIRPTPGFTGGRSGYYGFANEGFGLAKLRPAYDFFDSATGHVAEPNRRAWC